MISKFFRLFTGAPKPLAVTQRQADNQIADIPRYPPFDRGLPTVSPDVLLQTQQDLIDRIEKTAGLTPAEFRNRLLPVIRNLAGYVHLLPATNTGHHRGAGGLFRMALEIALYSLQIANSTIYANKGSVSTEARYLLHPKWVYATFIAGLCSEIYRPIVNMVVVDDTGDKWPQLLVPLHDWITDKKKERYFIVWNVQDELDVIGLGQASSAYLLNAIVPMTSLQYMNEGNSEIVATMTTCVTGATQNNMNNQIRQIVVGVRNKVIERDIKSNSERYGTYSVGSHLEPHLIDAMRRLVRKKTWEVNTKGSRIWYSSEGIFVVWQPAAREIISLLTDDKQAGIPQDADTLADIMVTSGIAERNDDDGRYWEICIPVTMQILPAIKLSRVEILFQDMSEIVPVKDKLVASSVQDEDSDADKAAHAKLEKTASVVPPAKIPKISDGAKKNTVPSVQTAPIAVGEVDKADDVVHAEPEKNSSIVPPSVAPTNPVPAVKPATGASNSRKAATPKSKTTEEDLGALADKLLASLPRDVSDYLRAVIEDCQEGESTGPVFSVEGGMAISTIELEAHGQANFAGLIKALYDKGWLWADPVKPMRKMHDIEHDGKKLQVVIIRSDISRGMGFDWKKPKKAKGAIN